MSKLIFIRGYWGETTLLHSLLALTTQPEQRQHDNITKRVTARSFSPCKRSSQKGNTNKQFKQQHL